MCLGVPARVVELLPKEMARVDVMGNETTISIRLTPEVNTGEFVLVHAGFAMEIIDEDFALETVQILEELEEYAQR
ncbi:MAG: HypC/HybG/HupF family hydrogenase formation chaperone [Solirubrobacterales bacterium]